jgi:Xaa-Pro aminopeptidase
MTETRVIPLSLAERDRRWQAIRARMAERGLDCLVIRGISSKWDSGTANVRYVSQIGGNGEEAMAVFPLDRDPVVFIWAPSQLEWWPIAQDWVSDVRQGSPTWAGRTSECLRELGSARGRIGVVGIGGRNEAGKIMSYDIYRGLLDALPEARFEPASDILEDVRVVKSPEEIEFLARSAHLCDVAVQAMLRAARPGVRAYEVYGEIMGAVFRAGGESPMFLMYEADPEPRHALRFPSDRVLERGYMIIQEISPKYAGYWTQVMVPVVLGEPTTLYRQIAEVAERAYQEGLKAIRPGATTKDVADAINRPIAEAGYTWYRPQFQGLGLEQSEEPHDRNFRGALVETAPVPLEEGMVLGLQPLVATADRKYGLQVGDTVAVTRDGVRTLGETKMTLYCV